MGLVAPSITGATPFTLGCEVPFTAGAAGFAMGLRKGIAGTIRPLLGALGVWAATLFDILGADVVTGGARAAATSGFDSVGGGGPLDI